MAQSHRTLLIFRRVVPEGKAIELRHQRTPDVMVAYVPSPHGARRCPGLQCNAARGWAWWAHAGGGITPAFKPLPMRPADATPKNNGT